MTKSVLSSTTLPTTMGWQTNIADSRRPLGYGSPWPLSQSRLVVQEMETERLDDVRRCQSFLLSHARGTETSSLAVACHVSTIFQIALGELKVDEICPLVIPLHLRYFSTNSPNSCKVPSHGSLDLPPSLLITPSSFQQGDAETRRRDKQGNQDPALSTVRVHPAGATPRISSCFLAAARLAAWDILDGILPAKIAGSPSFGVFGSIILSSHSFCPSPTRRAPTSSRLLSGNRKRRVTSHLINLFCLTPRRTSCLRGPPFIKRGTHRLALPDFGHTGQQSSAQTLSRSAKPSIDQNSSPDSIKMRSSTLFSMFVAASSQAVAQTPPATTDSGPYTGACPRPA